MRHRRREDRAASEKGLPGAGGYREHDILIVTEDEVEHLTRFPFGPEHSVVGAQPVPAVGREAGTLHSTAVDHVTGTMRAPG